jgi:CDP-diacylglycerol--glycerol-3-phosphate 3-phosphatidyltransferase
MVWNVPNGLTLARVALIPLFLFFLHAKHPLFGVFALAIFAIAALTDAVDGYLARSRAETTAFGRFMDPIADKILVMAALVSFVELGELPAVPVIVILAREFLVTGLRILAVGQGISIPASSLGKLKTISHVALVLVILIGRHFGLGPSGPELKMAFLYLAVFLALVSGGEYFWRARGVFGER